MLLAKLYTRTLRHLVSHHTLLLSVKLLTGRHLHLAPLLHWHIHTKQYKIRYNVTMFVCLFDSV